MPAIETIIVVTLAGLALSASPGPSMLYVLSRSVGQSRSAGLMSSAGLALGGAIHALAAALGLSALFAYSEVAYTTIKVLGALYLIYLGICMLISKNSGDDAEADIESVRSAPLARIFYQGIAVEVLNPKTILFFLAFIPQFVDPSRGSVGLQLLILGMIVPLTAIPSDLIVAFAGGSIADKLARNRFVGRLLEWIAGTFLIGLGIRIFLEDRPG